MTRSHADILLSPPSVRRLTLLLTYSSMAWSHVAFGQDIIAPPTQLTTEQPSGQSLEQSAETSPLLPSDRLNAASDQDRSEDAQEGVQQVFEPAFFDQFRPVTAIDMVERIPGFSLSGGGDNARGFGQASLNILINGRRPSSKSSNAEAILGRIPAGQVERIEILDGASLDIPGLSGQVANILTLESNKISGSWEYSPRFESGTQAQLLEGELSLSGKYKDIEYVVGFRSGQFRRTEDGLEQFFTPDGEVFEDRTEAGFRDFVRPQLDINLSYTPANGHVANLNLTGDRRNFNSGNIENFTAIIPQGETGQSIFLDGGDAYRYEIGGDYAFDLGPGNLKLIGLWSFDHDNSRSVNQEFLLQQDPEFSTFDNVSDEGEAIIRSEYNWGLFGNQDWQWAVEGAFNFLDTETLFEASSEPDPISDFVRVEELRAESTLSHTWRLREDFTLQTNLGIEFSDLDNVAASDPARQFVRPKGFLAASYDYSPRYTFRARAERGVGQLDFGTFVSNVDLNEDIQNGGNDLIVPEQFWDFSLEVERKDDKVISGTARAFFRTIEDPIDRIPLEDGSEGPGNLDSAQTYGFALDGTWLLDTYGLKGVRLEFEGEVGDSRIEDPVTGENRRINNNLIWSYRFDLRHDIPNTPYGWEVFIRNDRRSELFRLDQSFLTRNERPFLGASLIHKDIFGIQAELRVTNLLNFIQTRERLIFDGDRNGLLETSEFFARQQGRRVSLTLSNTF